jgi:hypothetical protein
MAEPTKSRGEHITELRAVIERLKTELAELERLRAAADKVNAGLDKALELRSRATTNADSTSDN